MSSNLMEIQTYNDSSFSNSKDNKISYFDIDYDLPNNIEGEIMADDLQFGNNTLEYTNTLQYIQYGGYLINSSIANQVSYNLFINTTSLFGMQIFV